MEEGWLLCGKGKRRDVCREEKRKKDVIARQGRDEWKKAGEARRTCIIRHGRDVIRRQGIGRDVTGGDGGEKNLIIGKGKLRGRFTRTQVR